MNGGSSRWLQLRLVLQHFESPLAWRVSLAAILVTLLLPLFLSDVPPLLDYPNHLARIFVLATGGDDPVLSLMYAPHWSLIPNLAVDVLGLLLVQIFPIHIAGRILIALAVLLPVTGLIYYARAISGVRSYWALAAGLLGYNALLLLGFLNFQISLGLAFISAAIWHSGRKRRLLRTTVAVAALAIVLFFCHIIGLVFLAILLFASEVTDSDTWESPKQAGLRAAGLAFAFAAPVLFYLLSDLAADSNRMGWVEWHDKLVTIFQPFLNYDLRLDMTTAAAVVAVLYLGSITGKGVLSRPASIAFIIAMIFYVVLPREFKGGTYFDNRFLVFAMFLLFACYVPKRVSPLFASVAGAVVSMLFAVRMIVLAFAWHGHATDVSELRQTISSVRPGSRVLVVSVSPSAAPAYWADRRWRARKVDGFRRTDSHMAALLLIERRAFWPLLFTVPSQHPLRVLSPYSEISVSSGELADYDLLAKDQLSADELRNFPYLSGWATRFDDVLVINSGAAPELPSFLPEKLQLVHATDMATLFRIKKGI